LAVIIFFLICGQADLMSAEASALKMGIIPSVTPERAEELTEQFSELLIEHGVLTAGVGIIKDGKLIWTGYFGEQSPGVPASKHTQFDVASTTKTITAETILRLVQAKKLSLDEPMSAYWVDPDLTEDSRHRQLTPRMALNHTTGFANWRFFSPDNKLKLQNNPGLVYGYSGEGFEYLARFASNKLKQDFEKLVKTYVFDPIRVTGVSLSRREANFENIVRAVDENGQFHGHYCRPQSGWCRKEGEFSAADDLRITVEDYAKFLIAVMNSTGYDNAIATDRNNVQVDQSNVPESLLVYCQYLPTQKCPIKQGYGLGWRVADYADYKLISHGGSDWSEAAITYFYNTTRDGVIIFLNAPNSRAITLMPHAIELIDPGSAVTPHYAHR